MSNASTATSPMDRATAIELGTDHIVVPVLFHAAGEVGIGIENGKVKEASIEAEKRGIRVMDILYAIGDTIVHQEDDTSINYTLREAFASPIRPVKLTIRRESPGFSVGCQRKKMSPGTFSSGWKDTHLCLSKGVLTRFESKSAHVPTDTIALTYDSKVEICDSAGKKNAITIVNGNGDDVGTYAFRDAENMQKVIERITDSIAAEQHDPDSDVKIIPRASFIQFLAVDTVVEGKTQSGEYAIGHVVNLMRDPSGHVGSMTVNFVNGEQGEVTDFDDIRQPYSSLTHTQAAKLYKQSVDEKKARASSGSKGFRRSMSSKKSRHSIPGWMSAQEAKQIDALFIPGNCIKEGELSKFDDGRYEKNFYAVMTGYLVVFSKVVDESQRDAEQMKNDCLGAYRLGEVSHATIDTADITVNLKYSCGVVVVLKAEGLLAAEEWKRALIGGVRQDIVALPTAAVALDLDGDGVIDVIVEGVDADGDGIPDSLQVEHKVAGLHPDLPIPAYTTPVEIDVDGDGIPDVVVYMPDADEDGVPDVLQAPTVETTLTTPVEAGAKKLDVACSDGFKIGKKVLLCMPGKEDEGEECVVAGFGSLLLEEPTKNAYGAGACVSQIEPRMVAIGVDLDGDGIPDVIVLDEVKEDKAPTLSRDVSKKQGRMCFCF